MTTTKPEVVAWIWGYRGRHMATTDYSQALELAEPPYPTEVEPLIRLSDYEALRAEYEEELFCVRQDRDSHFGEMMRALEQVDALQAECEKLRKDAELWRSIVNKKEPGKRYGCHCDLHEGMEPDGCVIDSGERHHCIYAKGIDVKEQCEYWRVIAKDSAMQEERNP